MTSTNMKKKALFFLNKISAFYPGAKIELNYEPNDPWQLLVAVVLSAQSTDVRVNMVTPSLFKAFPTVQAFALADPIEVEKYIRSLGFFRVKAKNIVMAARKLVNSYGGKVPSQRHLLEELPGVGAKSAAVIIANVFGEPAIAVDTHVGRIARRLGLSTHLGPSKVEKDLTLLLPRKRLLEAHHAFIWHGRRTCRARNPACSRCPVSKECPRIGVTHFF